MNNNNYHRYAVRVTLEGHPDYREFGWHRQYQFPEEVVEFLDKLDDWKFVEYHFGVFIEDFDPQLDGIDKKITFEVIEYKLEFSREMKMWTELGVRYTRSKMMSSYAFAKNHDGVMIIDRNDLEEEWEDLLE